MERMQDGREHLGKPSEILSIGEHVSATRREA